jgi:hypothetical protein
MVEHLAVACGAQIQLALVDRGVTAAAAAKLGRHHDLHVRPVGWEDKQPVFLPSGTPGVLKSPTAGYERR